MNKKIMYITISIFLVILILFSSTYALLFKVDETDKQSYTTGMLQITSETTNNSVTLNNPLPMSDSDGANTTPYTFKITNVGNLSFKFNVMFLSTTTSNQISSEYIKIKVNDNNLVKLTDLTNGIILSNTTLKPNESIEISLRVWLDENTPNTEIGKSFTAKVVTEGEAIYDGKSSANNASLTTLNKLGLEVNTDTPTLYKTSCSDGCQESTVGVYSTKDDLGTSYYFRGDVKNNYVYFAGLYWRIIRINGDGSLRIIYDGTSIHTNGESSTDRFIDKVLFNEKSDDNAYVGYMYGAAGQNNYTSTHENKNNSIVKKLLNDWYTDVILNTDNSKYVADAIYCNDRKVNPNYGYGEGFGTEYTDYNSVFKYDYDGVTSLKCERIEDRFTVSDNIEGIKGNGNQELPVGLITYDEVVYAGGFDDEKSYFYLYEELPYWTMTPQGFDGADAKENYIEAGGGILETSVSNPAYVRPVISLSANITYSGTGYADDPFVVKGLEANSPDLVQGLVPVTYDESTSSWVKADSANSKYTWYDYNEKRWANAVLVNNDTLKEKITSNVSVTLKTFEKKMVSTIDEEFTGTTNSFPPNVKVYKSYSLNTSTGYYTLSGESTTVNNTLSAAGYYVCYNACYSIFKLNSFKNTEPVGNTTYYVYNVTAYTSSVEETSSPKYVSTSYTLNNDGTYTLNNPTKQKYYTSSLINYYTCDSEVDEPCSTMYKIKSVNGGGAVISADKYETQSAYYNKYENASVGTPIDESDILAYYVWIPRYKYKVWNIDKQIGVVDSYNAYGEGIDIVFESGKSSTGTISCTYNFNVDSSNGGIDLNTTTAETCTGSNGEYYTHPAFTFGNDELRGFWISKFEMSSSDPTAEDGGGNVTSLTVRSLPNVNSWRYITVGTINTVIQNMQISNNIYGLSTSRANTDSHMLKNMEWGAVAYLTNSNYGRCTNGTCTEVTINNCSSNITGIGGDTVSASSSSTTCTTDANKYNGEKGMLASTTGNITGVYDMSGGAWEYVMGNMSSVTSGYTFYPSSSGLASSWYTSNQKYVNTYAYEASYDNSYNQKAYNRGKLGDATAEVVLSTGGSGGWYGDSAYFPNSNGAWFIRGGHYLDGSNVGPFHFNVSDGCDSSNVSSRLALVSLPA